MIKQSAKFVGGDKELYDKFTIKKEAVVGRGNNFVYQVEDQDGNVQCVKEVKLEDQGEFVFRKEVELLGKLKMRPHPNIVEFKGSYCTQERNQMKSKKGYIQMEKGITNLKDFMHHKKQKRQYFDEDQVLIFMCSMIDAFTHLQKIELGHRDIKPSNIIIFEESPLFFKICDVGAGTAVGVSDMTQSRTVTGTVPYLSPELFLAFQKKQSLVNYKVYKSDSYSLGLVFLEFCTLERMETRLTRQKQIIDSSIVQIKKRYPNIVGIGKVLRKMLDDNIKTRYDFIELQDYINSNDLLRNKINATVQLDPDLIKKLTTSRELLIQKFEDLSLLSKIISSGNKAPKIRINLSTSNGHLSSQNQKMIQQMKNIRHIFIEELQIKMQMCQISQKQAQIIAYCLSKNMNLRCVKLNLWNNKIKSEGLQKIMTAIQSIAENLQQITIYVPKNEIKISSLFQNLFDFSKAKKLLEVRLNLGFNQIVPQFFVNMMKGISLASDLRVLELTLQQSKLNHVYFRYGMKQLQSLKNLNQLYINASDNSIRDEGMFGVCDLVSALPEIKQLSLLFRNSQIGDKGFHQFTKSISVCQKLSMLKINMVSNQFTKQGFKMSTLQNMKNMSSVNINLSNNKIGDMGMKALSGHMIGCPNIHRFKLLLDGTDISQKGCLYLGRLISQLPHLLQVQLSIRHNNVQLKGVQCICTGLLSTKKLKKLKLIFQGTKIGDYPANYLATCLLKIRTLASVDLNMENCDLSETTMQNIMKLVKQYSKKAEQITISMRKNKQIRMQLYEQIKKELNNSRIAIRVDHPSTLQYSQTS